jgi:hypothetical protein
MFEMPNWRCVNQQKIHRRLKNHRENYAFCQPWVRPASGCKTLDAQHGICLRRQLQKGGAQERRQHSEGIFLFHKLMNGACTPCPSRH